MIHTKLTIVGNAQYMLTIKAKAYEEPLDLSYENEDSLDYAVPDVALTSNKVRNY